MKTFRILEKNKDNLVLLFATQKHCKFINYLLKFQAAVIFHNSHFYKAQLFEKKFLFKENNESKKTLTEKMQKKLD